MADQAVGQELAAHVLDLDRLAAGDRRLGHQHHAGVDAVVISATKASAASFTVQVQAERRLALRLHPAAGAAATTTHGPPGHAHGQRQRTGSSR